MIMSELIELKISKQRLTNWTLHFFVYFWFSTITQDSSNSHRTLPLSKMHILKPFVTFMVRSTYPWVCFGNWFEHMFLQTGWANKLSRVVIRFFLESVHRRVRQVHTMYGNDDPVIQAGLYVQHVQIRHFERFSSKSRKISPWNKVESANHTQSLLKFSSVLVSSKSYHMTHM